MKNILNFIGWQYRKLETWQKWYLFAGFLFGGGVGYTGTPNNWASMTGIGIIFFMMCKWFIWDALVSSYKKYQEERNTLFQNIKESDAK